jgi:ATP-dependent DNA helicase RecQ
MLRLVEVDHEHFGVLRLTAASREVLKGERRLQLRRPAEARKRPRGRQAERTRAATTASGRHGSGAGLNEVIYQALRAWRLQIAREHDVPAYTVFHDSTLQELARRLPRSASELRSISGVGAAKLERYGAALLALVRDNG